MERQLVVFRIAGEEYGVEIHAVDSVIMPQRITAVPYMPAFIEGVTNVRGMLLPVVDLRRRFGRPAEAEGRETRVLVVESAGFQVGLVVDAVNEVLRLAEEDVEALPRLMANPAAALIRGIAKVGGPGGRLITLLDLERLLSAGEQSALATLDPPSALLDASEDELR